jgi:hypothetical protein
VARREEKINVYRVLAETELGGRGRDLETDKWQAVVNTVMNTHIPYNAVNSCRAEELVAFPEGLYPRWSE